VTQTLAVFHVKHFRRNPLPHEQQPGPTYSRCVDRSTRSNGPLSLQVIWDGRAD